MISFKMVELNSTDSCVMWTCAINWDWSSLSYHALFYFFIDSYRLTMDNNNWPFLLSRSHITHHLNMNDNKGFGLNIVFMKECTRSYVEFWSGNCSTFTVIMPFQWDCNWDCVCVFFFNSKVSVMIKLKLMLCAEFEFLCLKKIYFFYQETKLPCIFS